MTCYLFTEKLEIPTDQEQATGLERKELDALIAGVDVCCWQLYCDADKARVVLNQ